MTSIYVREWERKGTDVDIYRNDGSSTTISSESSVYISDYIPVTDEDSVRVDVMFDFAKSKEDQGLVSGWASVAINKDGSLPLDWADDVIAPLELEKAAIAFMEDYRESGKQHKGDAIGVVVESIVFTKEKQEAIGIPEGSVPEGWFITVKLNDAESIAKVKDGTYKMFSIQGSAKRVKL